ncbi:MAG TPA: alpha-amylase family protein [Nakamurella sp.]|nr:alpha-amylase family protein [Nakamurella sp.]
MIPGWYRDAIIYQVDPRTFLDLSGDGSGDLAGVVDRLHHLRGLGVTCLWLLPFYPSPFRDGGYDITDHLGVDPSLGTISDMVQLIQTADELGIRVVVELVVQHTSDRHPWFQQARADRDSPYRYYYVWADEPEPSEIEPVFPGTEDSVWARDALAGQYYRHAFYSHEPDLNLANPAVLREVEKIVAFWLQMGVSGFRLDGAPYIPERTKRLDATDGGLWWFDELNDFVTVRSPGAVLLGEVDVPVQQYADYFADGHRVTMLLNFWSNNHLFLALARQDATSLAKALRQQPPPPARGQYANWLRNNDELDLERLTDDEREEVLAAFAPREEHRIYGRGIRRRLAPMLDGDRDRIAMAHALLLSLPGVPVLHYGEEIGMGDDLGQPEREAVRTVMQWSAEHNAGFSPVPPDRLRMPLIADGPFGYREVNVYRQVLDQDALLYRIGNLSRTRGGLPQIGSGETAVLDSGCSAVLGVRHGSGGETVVCLVNVSDAEVEATQPDGEWVDVIADRPYPPPEPGAPIPLRRYGYRWLREKRHLVD